MFRNPRPRPAGLLRRMYCRLRAQDGSSLVEFALVLSFILTPLMLGVLEFGRVAWAEIEVTDAARAGVAYGARNLVTASDLTGMQTAASNDAADKLGGSMTPTASTICKCSDGNVMKCSNAATSCANPKHAMEYVQVTTKATIDPLFYVPGLPKTYTVNGSAIMRVQ
jgi:Flp pilus assembly protein TadG